MKHTFQTEPVRHSSDGSWGGGYRWTENLARSLADDSVILGARRAAQDHGAARFIGNNADAGTLGECGERAARVVLEYLRSDGGAWLTVEGATEVDRLLRECHK